MIDKFCWRIIWIFWTVMGYQVVDDSHEGNYFGYRESMGMMEFWILCIIYNGKIFPCIVLFSTSRLRRFTLMETLRL